MPGKGIAETARLIASLELKDKLGPGITSASRSLGKLETRFSRIGGIASKGMATAARNITTIGLAAAGAIAGLVALSVKEGQEAQRVQLVYAKAISNSARSAGDLKKQLADLVAQQSKVKAGSKEFTKLDKEIVKVKGAMAVMGPVTAAQTKLLNAQQTALMNLAGVDDELIKAEQTKLIQMGLSGDSVRKLTPLILDMSKATGKDLLVSTIAVGKAVNGNVGGLAKFGVIVDKTKAKVDPFGAVMDALNKKFGGTTKALSGTLEARLGALREGLANIREEAGIKLLPALTHIVDVVGKAVVPAFGKLVDRIMPGITAGIDDLAKALESGGAEKAIGGIADALGTMIGLLQAAAGPVKMIVGAFMALPKEVQTILVAGFAVNKLTGGMVTQLAGEILFKRGGSPANPLFVADVTGGLGGLAGKGGLGKAAGLLATLTSLPVLIGAAVIAGVSTITWEGFVMPKLQEQAAANIDATGNLLKSGSMADLERALRGLEEMPGKLDPLKKILYDFNASGIKTHTEALEQAIRDEIASREKLATEEREKKRTAAMTAAQKAIQERAEARGKHPTQAAIEKTAIANLSRVLTGKDPYTGKPIGPGHAVPEGGAINKLTSIWGPRLESILNPARAGVRSRAEASGKHPTESAIDKTIAKNTARAAAETKAAATASAIAARVQAIASAVTNMHLGAIAAKDFSPKITVPVYVTSTVSVRGMSVAQSVRAAYNHGFHAPGAGR